MNNHWRWNQEPRLLGIPGYSYLPLLLTIYIGSWWFFFSMLGVVVVNGILARYGLSFLVLVEKLKHKMRGNKVTARPWWFVKKFQNKG